jgi:integrase
MTDKRVRVWVQRFKDRDALMLQWTDPDTGKRKSRSAETADPEIAEQKRADLEYELGHGKYQEVARITWAAFRERFEEEYVAATRKNTQNNYLATLDLFEKICAPKRLASVTERTVSLYAAGLRKEPGRGGDGGGMKPSTVKVRLQFLHTALSWAVEQKMLSAIPKFPAVKMPKKDPQPVAVEAFERLLARARAEDAQLPAYLLCGWLAGLRLGEALALEWEESTQAPYIDLARDRIVLPAEVVKADRDQWVPLDPELRRELEALPRHGRKVFRFLSAKTGMPVTVSGMSQVVRYLARRAGVKLTMKALRRGFGCRYAGRVSAHVLQKLMRHANIKTTLDFYANIDAAVEEAVLGAKRNSSRNTEAGPKLTDGRQNDATPSPDSPNSPSAS